MILDVVESLEPERGNLVEHCALVWNGVGQDHVKGRDAIRGDKEERLAEIKDFAHFPAAQLLDSWKIDERLCSGLHGQTLNAQHSTFNVQFRITFVECWTLSVGR